MKKITQFDFLNSLTVVNAVNTLEVGGDHERLMNILHRVKSMILTEIYQHYVMLHHNVVDYLSQDYVDENAIEVSDFLFSPEHNIYTFGR